MGFIILSLLNTASSGVGIQRYLRRDEEETKWRGRETGHTRCKDRTLKRGNNITYRLNSHAKSIGLNILGNQGMKEERQVWSPKKQIQIKCNALDTQRISLSSHNNMLKKDQKESEPDEKEERNIRDQNIQIQSVTYEGKDKRILLQGRQQETDRDKKIRFHFPYWWTTVTQIKTLKGEKKMR